MAGLLVALIHASGMRVADYMVMLGFVVAYALVDAMNVRLARGDTVFIDGAIALASVFVLSPSEAVISCLLGVALGAMFDTRNQKQLVVRLGEILRRPLLVAALAALTTIWLDLGALAAGNTVALLEALGLGVVYSVVDFALLAIGTSLEKHIGIWSAVLGLSRPLTALYASHISLGVVAALLVPRGRLWGLGVLVLLVLLIQYSFNLLLKTKGAYGETIQALVRASELQSGAAEAGHAQRVADLCVHAGRLLGLSSKALERLNYAALLHEVGRIGLDETMGPVEVLARYPERGAAIVGGIPFLASVQAVIGSQSAHANAGSAALDEEDTLCARLVGVCCVLDRFIILNDGRRWTRESLAKGLDECAPQLDARLRTAVLDASRRVLHVQKTAF